MLQAYLTKKERYLVVLSSCTLECLLRSTSACQCHPKQAQHRRALTAPEAAAAACDVVCCNAALAVCWASQGDKGLQLCHIVLHLNRIT